MTGRLKPSTFLDPLEEIETFIAAASESDSDSMRLLFVARARAVHSAVAKRLAEAERVLEAQELECLRRGK
jgi:hypothetical protein